MRCWKATARGGRSISIIANLNDIAQNLTLMIENPQLTAQATASLQTQVAALRNNASRMPPPFSDMLRGGGGGV